MNGTFLRGTNPTHTVLVCVEPYRSPVPGLAVLHASVSWAGYSGLLPGTILQRVLVHARQATDHFGRPVEQQYWVTHDCFGGLTVFRPEQYATAQMVITPRTDSPILVDIHSHHGMPARFSQTDDIDDRLTMGVSVVIGTIFTKPTIRVRLNIYGHTQEIPASMVFSELAEFNDVHQGAVND